MDAFIPDTVKAILLGLIAIMFVLSRLARWFPHVAVLQVFRLPVIQMSEAERERRQRSGGRMAGIEIVLAGVTCHSFIRFHDHVVQRTYCNRHNDRDCLFTLVYCPWDLDFRAELVSSLRLR